MYTPVCERCGTSKREHGEVNDYVRPLTWSEKNRVFLYRRPKQAPVGANLSKWNSTSIRLKLQFIPAGIGRIQKSESIERLSRSEPWPRRTVDENNITEDTAHKGMLDSHPFFKFWVEGRVFEITVAFE
jgi:hypothetical protein